MFNITAWTDAAKGIAVIAFFILAAALIWKAKKSSWGDAISTLGIAMMACVLIFLASGVADGTVATLGKKILTFITG